MLLQATRAHQAVQGQLTGIEHMVYVLLGDLVSEVVINSYNST